MIFETNKNDIEYEYTINLADCLPTPKGELVTQRADIEIFKKDGLESRLIGVKGRDHYYAYYEEAQGRKL